MLNKWNSMCKGTEEQGERGEWFVWLKPRCTGVAVGAREGGKA